jgi:hypothetical protein
MARASLRALEKLTMKRPLVGLCAAAAALFAATAAKPAASAGRSASTVPPVGTYVSGGPAWYPAPVRYAPPVVYAPARSTPSPTSASTTRRTASMRAGLLRRAHYWAAPAPRWHHGWNRHDRWHHDGGQRR